MSDLLWKPSPARIAAAQMTRFAAYAAAGRDVSLRDYSDLQRWSVTAPEAFWATLWDFCEVQAEEKGARVLENGEQFPGARWFPQARLNFAQNLLRYRDAQPALVTLLENGERRELSYAALYQRVAQLAAGLRAEGIGAGDRVAGFMPNIAETVIAMLAATSIGAVWSSCSPDFGVDGVIDRFGQIQPRVLFGADGYYYNGEARDSLTRLAAIVERIESIERVVVVPLLNARPQLDAIRGAVQFADYLQPAASAVEFAQLPFDHPLYIVYSSGTTGPPKCIVHGAGGTLLQHLKEHQLHIDLRRSDVLFYFTTCGWMMWNWLVSGLATGATLLLYDGAPLAREELLLDAIDSENISIFGTSARYIAALQQAGLRPCETHQLGSLKTILSTGSPLPHESFDYVYRAIKQDVCLSSISGGTDILSCFVGGCPILPVYRGEIQAPGLGMAVAIWNERGEPVIGQKGELVCCQPFPSAPIMFWNDSDGSRYRAAYFERWPNIWAQGDYGEITARGGVIIYGRSDAVLNPGGVRIGTAEIYRQVEKLPAVRESVAVGQQWRDDVRVVLFVVLAAGRVLDDSLQQEIRAVIRQHTTPRHVPDKIIAVADIPRTRSGKIAELTVRDVIHNRPAGNADALANPESLSLYRDLPELQG